MRYIYLLPDSSEEEQRKGIKEYLSLRGIYPGDCTTLQSDYDYDDQAYDQGIRNMISGLKHGDILYVWDFSSLAKSLENLYTNLLLGTNEGVSIVQCLDGTVASNESTESIAIVNAIGIASRIELKISKIQRRQKYTASQESKAASTSSKSQISRVESFDPDKIVIRRYSDKSVIVCGDSREYKEAIKEIGGLFNPKIDNGRPAWIVSLRKLQQLQEVLAGANYVVLQDCYISRSDYIAKQGNAKREVEDRRRRVDVEPLFGQTRSENELRTDKEPTRKKDSFKKKGWQSTSIGFQWVLKQLRAGVSRKAIVAEFNRRHATNPKDYSTSTGKPLTEAILSIWSRSLNE